MLIWVLLNFESWQRAFAPGYEQPFFQFRAVFKLPVVLASVSGRLVKSNIAFSKSNCRLSGINP